MEKIKTNVKSFLNQFIGEIEISDDANIFEMGLVNSLFAMQLIAYLENYYKIKLIGPGVSLVDFNSINGICHMVEQRIDLKRTN